MNPFITQSPIPRCKGPVFGSLLSFCTLAQHAIHTRHIGAPQIHHALSRLYPYTVPRIWNVLLHLYLSNPTLGFRHQGHSRFLWRPSRLGFVLSDHQNSALHQPVSHSTMTAWNLSASPTRQELTGNQVCIMFCSIPRPCSMAESH